MTFSVTLTIRRNGQPDRRLVSVTENVIDTDLARYWHADHPPGSGAAARQEVNLGSANAAALQSATGIDAALAQRIVNARPSGGFRNRDDFVARLGADGASVWHRLSSTAGIRLVF